MRGVDSTTAKSTNRPPRWVGPISRNEMERKSSGPCCAMSGSEENASAPMATTSPTRRARLRNRATDCMRNSLMADLRQVRARYSTADDRSGRTVDCGSEFELRTPNFRPNYELPSDLRTSNFRVAVLVEGHRQQVGDSFG